MVALENYYNDNTNCWQSCGKKYTFIHSWWGISCYNRSGKLSAVPTKPETIYDLTVFLLGV